MMLMRIRWVALVLMVTLAGDGRLAVAQTADADHVVPVWPTDPPAWNVPQQTEQDTTKGDGRFVAGKRVIRLGFVSKPQLHVYRADGDASTAVLICPGGGYSILAWDLEGTEIATWLQGIGVTAVVLKYRVPTRNEPSNWLAPVQDIQRSLSLIRGGALDGVSPKRVGVLGFSAGGNAAARAATTTERMHDPVDELDQASVVPDFAVLVYPARLVDEDDPTRLAEGISVSEKSPPIFFAHAADDRLTCLNSVTLYQNLFRAGVTSSALHIFSKGGHGFGGRMAGDPTDAWQDLCADWLRSQGWLTQ